MATVLRQLLWAFLYAALSLPLAYGVTMLALSWIKQGYVMVDPVHLRRISVAFAVLVLAGVFLLERFH